MILIAQNQFFEIRNFLNIWKKCQIEKKNQKYFKKIHEKE